MKNWELSFFIHFPTQLSKDRMGKSKSITFEAYIWFWFIIFQTKYSATTSWKDTLGDDQHRASRPYFKKYLNFHHEYTEYTLSNNMWDESGGAEQKSDVVRHV